MHYLIGLLITLLNHQEPPAEVAYTTTAEKIKMVYRKWGSRLSLMVDSTDKFAMNGQMYQIGNYAPVGLYVENRKIIHKANLVNNNSINFGINPQAVFFIDTFGKAGMVDAKKANAKSYQYATQIAPMLLINGEVNEILKGFKGKCRDRNGIGIKSNGEIVFLIAKKYTTFPEFADMFKDRGCVTAAFIDGGISEHWIPGKETYQDFGVIITSD